MRRTLVPALAAAALLAAGCGGSDNSEKNQTPGGGEGATSTNGGGGNKGTETASSGKQLFAGTCGSCHTLKAAGTKGTFGPNLDQLKPDEATVRKQIRKGGGGMPAGLLKGKDAATVAPYVASTAGTA